MAESSYIPNQQLDIPYVVSGFHIELPRHLPGRTNTDDFVFFNWPSTLDASKYDVVIEALDTSGSRFRNIGPLTRRVYIPFVKYGADSIIGVVPRSNPNLPRFVARMDRMATYNIPNPPKSPGEYKMMRLGNLSTAVDNF